MSISDLFIDVKTLPQDGAGFFQLVFLGCTYAYLLMYGSNLISDGSELLLLVPSLSGVVGSIVLPVLGAVPDGCIVLFSGMGPDAQQQLDVGVGALAGSTIMLLTIPWFLSVLGGRVNIDPTTKLPRYKAPKLTPPENMSLTETGVTIAPAVNVGAYIMIGTSITYLLLQAPGMIYMHQSVEAQAAGEKWWAVLGTFVCLGCFAGYLYYCYVNSGKDEVQAIKKDEFVQKAIRNKETTLLGVMSIEYEHLQNDRASTASPTRGGYQGLEMNEKSSIVPKGKDGQPKVERAGSVTSFNSEFIERLDRILKPFFEAYDVDKSGSLNKDELLCVFNDLGERLTLSTITTIFNEFDRDRSGSIDYKEFVRGVACYVSAHESLLKSQEQEIELRTKSNDVEAAGEEEDDEEEEEDEMPDELKDLSPEEQQKRVKMKSAWMMGLGTIILVLISDPMVDVLSELGVRTGIPAFYIAFVLAPLASNASELIAAYNYAKKKTATSMSISLATLEGAAVMNNTFVLGTSMLR